MKVDRLDHTLVCENDDIQTVLGYFKDKRKLPEYIEIAILQIVFKNIFGSILELGTIKDYWERLPKDFIKETVQNIKDIFQPLNMVSYEGRYLSYLMYYLPGNVFKVWKPLLDLQLRNTLKPHMRILDVGTGPGSVPIGIIEYYKALAESFPEINFNLSFSLIDKASEFLSIASELIMSMVSYLPDNLKIVIENKRCDKVDPNNNWALGEFDLLVMSNFFSIGEGYNSDQAVPIINSFINNIKADGSLIIIEPGNKTNCLSLKNIRNQLFQKKILNIFSPCIGLWEEKSSYDCMCFSMVRCYWEVPHIYLYLINNGLRRAKRVDVPFNYLILRRDSLKKYPVTNNLPNYTRLADIRDKVGQVINVLALIRTVVDRGNNVSFSLCDGTCSFSEDNEAIWVDISKDQLKQNGIDIPLIAAERIWLKKVLVNLNRRTIRLDINKNSRIIIDY